MTDLQALRESEFQQHCGTDTNNTMAPSRKVKGKARAEPKTEAALPLGKQLSHTGALI